MNPLGTKALIGVGFAGALGGAGYGVHVLTDTSDTVSNYFKRDDTIRLVSQDTSSESKWTKAYDAYSLEKDEIKLSITDQEINGGTDIKNWCALALTKTVKSTSDLLYRQAKKWCTEFKTISEQIGSGKRLVSEVSTLEGQFNGLPEELKTKIESVVLDSGVSANTNGEKIKKWCETNSKRSYKSDTEFYYKYASQHCFVP